MKRLMMIAAIAFAANFAALGVQPLMAEDAHHPADAAKSKTVQTRDATKPSAAKTIAAKKKPRGSQSARMRMMNCPMMKNGQMGQGGMMGQGNMMMGQGSMDCPMMTSGGGMVQGMNMMQGAGSQMMGRTMRNGEPMMGQPDRCWITTDRDRGFGYWGACNR